MKIALIGAGNVATHLSEAFYGRAEICQVIARTDESASHLAAKINNDIAGKITPGNSIVHCEALSDISLLRNDMDIYLIAVNDDSIADVVEATPDFPGIWAHTSGSVSMEVLKGKKSNYGVFYPLQTFSKDVDVSFDDIPILIEASSTNIAETLAKIASEISNTVKMADSKTREALHVAAVFACNFANLMWCEADRLLHSQGMDIRFMLPLLRATLDKLTIKSPYDAMTGPARRKDISVIEKHLTSLPDDLKPAYSLLSNMILNLYA